MCSWLHVSAQEQLKQHPTAAVFLKLQFQELPQIHSHAIHCNSIMSQIAKAIQQILSKFENLALFVTIDDIETLLPFQQVLILFD